MAIIHEFLVGSTVDYQKSLFFDLMLTGDIYLGFGRKEPIWGFSTLIKLNHLNSWPTNVMGQSGDESGAWDTKYFDLNSVDYLPGASVPATPHLIHIGWINNGDDPDDISKYSFLDTVKIGTLELDYMNEEWCRIRGMNPEYLDSIQREFPTDTYDYYIFNRLGSSEVTSRIKIETVDRITLPQLKFPIRLMYANDGNATVPTSAFGSNVIGNLTRSLDIYGQEIITGMEKSFVSNGAGYISDNNLTNATFFLTNADGVVLQDDMTFVTNIADENETSLTFSYPLVGEATQNSGRIKITKSSEFPQLAIFSERFTDGLQVNDSTPAPLVLSYLKTGMIHSSLLEVMGMEKVVSADIKFARRIDNDATEALLQSVEGINFPADEQVITIDNNPDTTVRFATTTDVAIARQYYFDLVMITKTVAAIGANSPTEDVYRQLFVCYKPQTSGGVDVSATIIKHTALFDTVEHTYDLGTMLFICNKKPIFRKHLSPATETFTLLV